MGDLQLAVDPRVVTGKKVKSLRREGIVPAHLYGRGTESLSLQTSKQTVANLLRTAGSNQIIDLQVNGESEPRPVVLRGIQRDPVTGDLVHIDFFQISLTERLRAEVQIVLTGEPPAVQVHGGVLLQTLDHLTIEALPADIPEHIEVDVSGLEELDTSLFVQDLRVPSNVEVVSAPDQMVVKVAAPRLAAEIEAEEAAAAAEGEAAEEGAVAPAEEGAPAGEKAEEGE